MLNLRKLLGIERPAQAAKKAASGAVGGAIALKPKPQLSVKPNYGLQSQQVNPVDMDTVPGNAQFGQHPAYYQGSNPFQNMPTRNVYNNISPMPVDEMQYGRQIQPGYTNRFNFWN